MNKSHLITLSSTLLLGLFGCASTPGAKPLDMSAQQHERMAGQAETHAAQHTAQYDPAASLRQDECVANQNGSPICWSSAVNPTQSHVEEARRFQKIAADHRAAGRALHDAEAKSCGALSPRDRDMSPFRRREDILRVDPIETHTIPEFPRDTHGAIVVMRPTPGLTAERLQALVDCHIARNASMGFEMPEMQFCPLSVKGASAKVTRTRDGNLAVAISGRDVASGDEVNRRAQRLR